MSNQDAASVKGSSDGRASQQHMPSDGLTNPHKTHPTPRRTSRAVDQMNVNHTARKMSVFRRLSIASSSQYSSMMEGLRKPAKLENTYKMVPDPDAKFNASRVEKVISGVLNSYLDGEDYEPRKCTMLAKNLSDVIKSRVKDMGFDRYKIVCSVNIGQLGDYSMQQCSRCLWNTDTDSFASASYRNNSLYSVVSVYATYFE